MSELDALKQDAGIATILQRLKSAKPATKEDTASDSDAESELSEDTSLYVPIEDVEISSLNSSEDVESDQDDEESDQLIPSEDSESEEVVIPTDDRVFKDLILPWFDASDKDLGLIHYASFSKSGDLVYSTAKTNLPTNDLAAIKMKDDYACDIDYYKSKHYVLCVKQIESHYDSSRIFTPVEAVDKVNESEELAHPTLAKVSADDSLAEIVSSDKYNHFIVFTDLGVAEFTARQSDVTCPCNSDLNKWFEDTSNYSTLLDTTYTANPLVISDEAGAIRDFRYDIITIHRPGIITLDSIDNEDSSYRLHIKLKDEYSFIPFSRVLGCLRHYVKDKSTSMNHFKRFIDKYFTLV